MMILSIIGIVIFLSSIVWFLSSPSWEPAISTLTSVGFLAEQKSLSLEKIKIFFIKKFVIILDENNMTTDKRHFHHTIEHMISYKIKNKNYILKLKNKNIRNNENNNYLIFLANVINAIIEKQLKASVIDYNALNI